MPDVGAALTTVAGVQVVPVVPHEVGIVTGRGTESVGSVHADPPPHSTVVSESLWIAVSLMSNRDPILQGAAAVHLVVPVESVNGVADAVRFQPSPVPVASSTVTGSWTAMVTVKPVRVVAQSMVPDVAVSESVPDFTVTEPVTVQRG